ncbi:MULTISPECIES: AAA family ATPase [unclassified Bradyrhizobium]|uniref:AAA family ATPase n=1 Tax=unclassified Bradyrhizobium TaxID=2631580 RepID=UPI001FFBCF06|nr:MULTISPECIES: AAA family ATPase [unclassified Bradyrhizobium]
MTDDTDDTPFTDFDLDLLEGAAEDSAASDDELAMLPRILRYGLLASRGVNSVHRRLAAEIEESCPGLPFTAAWLGMPNAETGHRLAAELDHRAVAEDKSELRGLADCIRLTSLILPRDRALIEDHRRVARALLAALRKLDHDSPPHLAAEAEAVTYGWAALPVCADDVTRTFQTPAATAAAALGARMATYRMEAATAKISAQATRERVERTKADLAVAPVKGNGRGDTPAPNGQVVVAQLDSAEFSRHRLKDIVAPLSKVINIPLPLVAMPPLSEVRRALLAEFPYAAVVVDFVLADLVGRATVRVSPLLLSGEPGSGKTRFVERMFHHLGVSLWRTDATAVDGSAFGGTDRRWSSAQVCRPMLAIARAGHANPGILIDEIDKTAVGREYGRLLDCLLAFLELETARQYPDPALQTALDLRHVSYVATANHPDTLPSPLRDRFRHIEFPRPTAEDLEALLPAVIADILRDRGLDRRWMIPFTTTEKEAIARHWHGGSVRRLRRIVEVVMREHDAWAARN